MIRLGHVFGNLMVNVQPTATINCATAPRASSPRHRGLPPTGRATCCARPAASRLPSSWRRRSVDRERSRAPARRPPTEFWHRHWRHRTFRIRTYGSFRNRRRNAARRRSSHQRLEELGAARSGGLPAHRRAGHPRPHPAGARHPHHGEAARRTSARTIHDGARRSAPRAGCRDSRFRRRPTTWSRLCAPRAWCSGRWWHAPAARAFRCPAAAPSARVPSTCMSTALEQLGARDAQEAGYIEATAPERPQGRSHHLRPHHRHRHRGRHDGRRAGRGRDADRRTPLASPRSATWPPC